MSGTSYRVEEIYIKVGKSCNYLCSQKIAHFVE